MNASEKAVPGAARAIWLSELSRSIDEALWLAWRIGVVEGRSAQALELYGQLEVVRAEVEALRGRHFSTLRHPPSTAFPAPLDALRNLAAAGKGLEE